MLFELSILRKYLVPRKRQLSVAFLATISVAVITTVVWLLLLFLSITEGIETTWLYKLTSLHAPLRITPTEAYFKSYYHLADTLSFKASYHPRSFAQKLQSPGQDLYDPSTDSSIPLSWDKPQFDQNKKLQDPVATLAAILELIHKKDFTIEYAPFELSGGILKLQIKRSQDQKSQGAAFLTQACYLQSFPENNSYIQTLLLPPLRDESSSLHTASKPDLSLKKLLDTPFSSSHPIILAKGFCELGVNIGDEGWIQYQAISTGALQEQQLSVKVIGFYDPGVTPIGNKSILASSDVVHLIHTSNVMQYFDSSASMGFGVWHPHLQATPALAAHIQKLMEKENISSYWKITTYRDYEFSKDLLLQFQSDRILFTFLGIIILIVACSNIVSFLILLVYDKRKEIGILQALGASKKSIALIFGACGALIGIISSLLGITAAFFTLKYLSVLVSGLSWLQGYPAFNPAFYGSLLSSKMSSSALYLIAFITPLLSFFAALIPALKACKLTPAEILRLE
ncbi:MAG: FtsX-like permease family protein [Candidatus Rhabdochlamydia sp.]